MTAIVALLLGLVFGAGLIVSGMTDPAKVIGFLDIAGAWDPTLAFVMGGAVVAAAPFFALARRRGTPLLGGRLDVPASARIDARLAMGAAFFGVGWGISGLCPGPAIVNVGSAPFAILPFVIALAAGLVVARLADGLTRRGAAATA